MSKKGGRPKDAARLLFTPIEENGKVAKMRCTLCQSVVSNKSARLRTHLVKCNAASFAHETNTQQDGQVTQTKKRPIITGTEIPDGVYGNAIEVYAGSSEMVKKCKIQEHVEEITNKFIMKTSSACKMELDLKMAKMFYATGMSFEIADHKHFKEAICALRPGYTCPTRFDMGNTLLNKVYEQQQETAKNMLQGRKTTLMQNGCNRNSENGTDIITHCLHSGKEVVYLNTVNTQINDKTTEEYFTNLAKMAIMLAENQYGCSVKSFVTDNEHEMEKMRENLENEDILTYVCSAHYLDLLGKDIERSKSDIMNHVTEVQKYFKNHHETEILLLKDVAEVVKHEISEDTRWYSNCLETFLRNRQNYLEIAASHRAKFDKRILAIINIYNDHNKELKEVMSLQVQFKRIVESIDKLQQTDSGTIADACEVWIDLLNNPELRQHTEKVEDRLNQALSPLHYLANMLHPKYQGAKVNFNSENKATDWLATRWNPDFIPYLLAFKSQEDPFPKTMFLPAVTEKTNPSTWWKSLKKAPIDPNFLQFVSEIMSFPANSVGLEKIFSNFSFDNTKIQNMFDDEKTFKLVYCYSMLNKD